MTIHMKKFANNEFIKLQSDSNVLIFSLYK